VGDIYGNLFFADSNHRIRRISQDGIITTIAGTGQPGYSGDGGPAIKAKLNEPYGVYIDDSGNIYIADSGNHRVRKISRDGNITTIAGTGVAGFSGDGGMAKGARLNSPQDIFVTLSNEIYINDEHNNRIRKISQDGIIKTVVGNGRPGYAGDGEASAKASLNDPEYLWVDVSGQIYVTDGDNNLVRKVDTKGIITTIAGDNTIQ
jgi:NHL repeat.